MKEMFISSGNVSHGGTGWQLPAGNIFLTGRDGNFQRDFFFMTGGEYNFQREMNLPREWIGFSSGNGFHDGKGWEKGTVARRKGAEILVGLLREKRRQR